MTVGFNTGAKWFDNYFEAFYEVIECYYKSLDKAASSQYVDYSNLYESTILPSAKRTAASLKGVYRSEYFNDYYEDFYKNYFQENSWDQIWSAYGYDGCNVAKIIKKWGFRSSKKVDDRQKSNASNDLSQWSDPIISAPNKFSKKLAKRFNRFDPLEDQIEIDSDSFKFQNNSASFADGKNKKAVKAILAKQDFDLLYDQKTGCLYFNENGSDPGFGNGGLIAILKGAPELNANNFEFS